MKLISWNVNGIRACLKKNFLDFIKKENPDILLLQETKAQDHQVQINLENYYQYWHSAEKKGYSGTAVFTKIEPKKVINGMNGMDNEGRVLTLEFDDFHLVDVYTPNSGSELKRLDYRTKEWDKEFLKYMKTLDKKKPVIFCGDLNVANKEIDVKNYKANYNKYAGLMQVEIDGLENIKKDFIDSFRHFYPDKIQYSWWSYRANARANNVGWRIDYFMVSKKLKDKMKDAFILDSVLGSDHAPVGLVLN